MKRSKGFTIVEIAVVIVILAVLITLTTLGFNRTLSSTRDNSADSKTKVIAAALEKYYSQNGTYPSCIDLTQSSSVVTTSVLPGIDPATLTRDGAGATSGVNSFICSGGADSTHFLYSSTATSYSIQYKQESGGTVVSVNSQGHLATSESPDKPTVTAQYSSPNVVATASSSPCSTGQLQFAFISQVNNGAWSTYGTYGTSNTLSQAAAGGNKYNYRVRAQCSGSSTYVESDISADTIAPIAGPTSTPTISVTFTSPNVVATRGNATCGAGTPEYQFQYLDTTTAGGGTWNTAQPWTTSTTHSHSPGAGAQSTYHVLARCKGTYATSSTVTSTDASAVQPIGSLSLPVWAGPASFTKSVYATVTYNDSCPNGITPSGRTFTSYPQWTTSTYTHTYPYSDYWTNATGRPRYVIYKAHYTCATDFATATSADSSNTITVNP